MASNTESESCEEVKIDPVVQSNPHLNHGVPCKGYCGVDNIPLPESSTLFVHGVSYHSLSVESLRLFPLVFLGKKLIVALVGVGNIWLLLCRYKKKLGSEFMRLQDSFV